MGHNIVILFDSQLPTFRVVQSDSQALLLAPRPLCLNIWVPVRRTKNEHNEQAPGVWRDMGKERTNEVQSHATLE